MTEPYTELESLVESIKQGQRVIFLPPGMMVFIAVNILLIGSFVTLFAPVLMAIGSDWEMKSKAITQLGMIVLAVLCIVPPAILITRGRKQFQQWFKLLSSALACLAALTLVAAMTSGWQDLLEQSPPLYICIIISSLAAYLAQSRRYTVLTQFYYLLHRK
jgi:SNF family Na+-dependent transporter